MLKRNSLHQVLESASDRHRQLAAQFEVFARHISEQVTQPNFHIKNIGCELCLEQAFFEMTFAGRNLRFTFASSYTGEGGALVGRVKCYLRQDFPQLSILEIGEFTFKGNGTSSLNDPESGDALNVCDDLSALYIALNYLHQSLVH